jgi:molybdopterin-guanine dinucleotide biosynthesis protein MobB
MSVRKAVFQSGAPVLAVCGFSGSGKTTLLEAVIPKLVERGLAIAVVKHDAHGFEVDKPGKDSDRLFRAGATISLSGPGQQFERRAASAALSLNATLARLGCEHDLVLVEGHKDVALPKLWLGSAEQPEAPEGVTNILKTLRWDTDRVAALMDFLDKWLKPAWTARPLYGGVLVGGASSRMGSAKQLILFGGRALGEIAGDALSMALGDGRSVALGAGTLPGALEGYTRLPDPPGFGGPAAALISAHRWYPEAAWIVAACDHPWLRAEHITWLAAQRQPGRWAVIPRQRDGHPYPTLALYEPQALEALECKVREDVSHNARPAMLLELSRTLLLDVPVELMDGWKNVNTPEELRAEEMRLAAPSKLATQSERGK